MKPYLRMTSAKGVPIQNDGKQDVFQQLHGWIQFGFASHAPHVLNRNTLGGPHARHLPKV